MREIITNKVEEYLAREYWCSPSRLHAGGVVYTVHGTANRPCIKIMAYRDTVVVCTSKDLAGRVRTLVENKSRDEIFELPLVYGQTIHYVPTGMTEAKCWRRQPLTVPSFTETKFFR